MATVVTASNYAAIQADTYLNVLVSDGDMWASPGSDAAGVNVELRYYLAGGWTASEAAVIRRALESWSNVAELHFTRTTNPNAAALYESKTTLGGGLLGQHSLPSGAFNTGSSFQADGEFDTANLVAGGLRAGSYGYVTLVHELGHGLGLDHPHAGLEVSPIDGSKLFPGVTHIFGDYGDNNLNQGIFTVMSYNDGWTKVQHPADRGLEGFGYVAGPMAFDIAAIQALYGANMTYHTGNNRYVLPDDNAPGTFWTCIWDAGGTDIVVYNGERNTRINLNDATLDNSSTGGGIPSFAAGIYGGVTIANSVVIENAAGGRGLDRIFGNEADNGLYGRLGNDRLFGNDGDDRMFGGAGRDALFGGADDDKLYGQGGNDRLYGAGGSDTINGGIGNDRVFGSDGGDVLVFSGGADLLAGFNGAGASDADIDTFQILNAAGSARVRDFGTQDLVDVHAFGYADFAALMTHASDTAQGVSIRLDGNTLLVIEGVTVASLNDMDFII